MHYAIRLIDPTFDDRLQEAYVKDKGGKHLTYNSIEYWAQGASIWFNRIRRDPVYYDQFLESYPLLYDLLAEWYDPIYLRDVESRVYE